MTTPTPTPPVDPLAELTTAAFWESPSTYIALSTYALPIASAIFHRDFSSVAQAITELAPVVATAVLIVMRFVQGNAIQQARANTLVNLTALAQQERIAALNAQSALNAALVARVTPATATKALNARLGAPSPKA